MRFIHYLRSKTQEERRKILRLTVTIAAIVLAALWIIKLSFEFKKIDTAAPTAKRSIEQEISDKFNLLKELFKK